MGGCNDGSETTEDTDTDTTGDPSDTDEPTTTDPPPPPPPADNTAPQLVGVEFLDPQILRLSFTEAIAPVTEVNPKRFRLSVGLGNPGSYYYGPYTQYFDVGQFNNVQDCYEVCFPYYYYYYGYYCFEQCVNGPPLSLDVLDVLPDAEDPTKVVLLLAQPALPRLCSVIQSLDGDFFTGGLLLHYADGGTAPISDLAGLPLGPIGKSWVIQSNDEYMFVDDVLFPEFNPLLPIPCPF